MKLDDVQCENIEFRKRKLQEKTNEIECIVSGRVNSILPYIRTQKGEYSESKTWKFIHELTDALNEYGVKYKFWYDNTADEYMDCIPEKVREYVECYLYCVIRVMESDLSWMKGEGLILEIPETNFQQILDFAKGLQTGKRKYVVLFDELYCDGLGIMGLFSYCTIFYRELTGEDITGTISEDLKSMIEEKYADSLMQVVEKFDGTNGEDLTEEEEERMFQEMWDNLPEEEKREREEWSNLWDSLTEEEKKAMKEEEFDFLKQFEEEREMWKKRFKEPETFCKCYLRYRELYFKDKTHYYDHFAEWIEGMLDMFLAKKGISGYANEDAFITAFTYLRKATRQITRVIEGE